MEAQLFAWEYKGQHANLDKAYDQLLQYREALENPPLLIVSDMAISSSTPTSPTPSRVTTHARRPAGTNQTRRATPRVHRGDAARAANAGR